MKYAPSTIVSLKAHPELNERWLQERILEDPSILGLGNVEIRSQEVRQPSGGRLDLLLRDVEADIFYEVELQLGPTDPSHIIRTIEYWDVERSRYPQYEHVAVIVAEDITSRFLNVISLFNKAIPIMAVQLHALEVDGKLTLHAATVVDVAPRPIDEDESEQPTDRNYWLARGSQSTMDAADGLLEIVNRVTPGMSLKFNKHYIGLARNGMPDNWLVIRLHKQHLSFGIRSPRSDESTAFIEGLGLDFMSYNPRGGRYWIRVSPEELAAQSEAIWQLCARVKNVDDSDS